MSDLPRRSFLRNLVSLPLIGGGVTLIGRAALSPVPLTQVAAAPILGDPRERARYAWEAFSAAMRDITADAHGWVVQGGDRMPFGNLPGSSWLTPKSVRYETGTEPRCPSLVVERCDDLDLIGGVA